MELCTWWWTGGVNVALGGMANPIPAGGRGTGNSYSGGAERTAFDLSGGKRGVRRKPLPKSGPAAVT